MSRFIMNGVASEAVMDEPETNAAPELAPVKKATAKKVADAKPKD